MLLFLMFIFERAKVREGRRERQTERMGAGDGQREKGSEDLKQAPC